MAKFLNTSAVTYHLEELIKSAQERLILISPYLKFNDRMRELLEDRDRLKIDIRIVYGKNELQPHENNWLKGLDFVRTSFCKNLHAKVYLNESQAIVASMNLYEFSQVNNNEVGVLIERDADGQLFLDAYQEAQRLIRISDELKVTVETVPKSEAAPAPPQPSAAKPAPAAAPPTELTPKEAAGKKISGSQLSKSRGVQAKDLFQALMERGWIERVDNAWRLTPAGAAAGGETRNSAKFGEYIVWPEDLEV